MSSKTSHVVVEAAKANKALSLEEPLVFEQGSTARSGVDLPGLPSDFSLRLGNLERKGVMGLPGLSEPQVVRHYTRLSQKNFGIDSTFYPLGSCTMKHNPRQNEKMARLPGFSDLHPMQPFQTVQGALELMNELARWLKILTGMPAVAMVPGAGAQGEMCGLAAIKCAIADRGETRTKILIPKSAHGTNAATAAALGYTLERIPANTRGRVDLEILKSKLGPDVAAVMITNPNTCGLFEYDMTTISTLVHKAGAYFYCDGANFNAIVGRVRPADLGIDAMHINLHKTFSTPHGGGGPGSGPVVLSEALAPFVPLPYVVYGEAGFSLIEHLADAREGLKPFGRIKGFHGQMGMFVRALSYILSHGSDGLWQVASDAVLSANYIRASLQDVMSLPFKGMCMHEVLFDDSFLADTGVTTADFAKALIDRGFHPMTVYFPLIVHGAFLIEPTETESKDTLDAFIDAVRDLVKEAKKGNLELFQKAPIHAPRHRLDETLAARKPILTWNFGNTDHEPVNDED